MKIILTVFLGLSIGLMGLNLSSCKGAIPPTTQSGSLVTQGG